MDLSLSYHDDFKVWDSTEAITFESARRSAFHQIDDLRMLQGPESAVAYHRQQRPDTADQIFVPTALRRAPNNRDLVGGVYTQSDVAWLIPRDLLPPGFSPKPSDRIITRDNPAQTWTILEAANWKFKTTWRFMTRDLTLSFDLRDTINIERAAITFDAAGAAVKSFPSDPVNPGGAVIYSQLPARVQLRTQEIVDERGIRGTKGSYDIVLSRQVELTSEDRVQFGGRYYEIRGLRDAESIQTLPVLECELLP